MIVHLPEYKLNSLTEEQIEQIYWDSYVFDSHRWVEYQKGYYQCSFCGAIHTSVMPSSVHRMCSQNPFLKRNNDK